jgi:muramoyltetrapeptide carboxypeptidase
VNAIYAMTGATAILGPNLSSFGQVGWKDSLDWLQQLLWSDSVLTLRKPQTWASGARHYSTNRSWKCTSSATASGTLIGGNLGSLYLLQGTKYMPRFDTPTILVIEDDAEAGVFAAAEFDRRIESLLQQPGARQHIVGVLVGRFEVASRVGLPQVQEILLRKFGDRIPIVYDMNFGHTQPALACLLAEWQQYRQQIRLYASALNQSIRNERIVP